MGCTANLLGENDASLPTESLFAEGTEEWLPQTHGESSKEAMFKETHPLRFETNGVALVGPTYFILATGQNSPNLGCMKPLSQTIQIFYIWSGQNSQTTGEVGKLL